MDCAQHNVSYCRTRQTLYSRPGIIPSLPQDVASQDAFEDQGRIEMQNIYVDCSGLRAIGRGLSSENGPCNEG